jgi:hypothetical protein
MYEDLIKDDRKLGHSDETGCGVALRGRVFNPAWNAEAMRIP